ncbi:unnamed protein product [Bursaphelenchus okinawaensis]|uniref:Uncharacterized protein n=1 Tax=Bursaphelenchus okinawaensis TaxID=465554 RepID=A0A811L5E8_9BILA|nr:unnamed protein product [Bursaphelenchus okinawaensis]CAG9119851.1 unnamed protein product [Bursaphelenchus okinawaensis]
MLVVFQVLYVNAFYINSHSKSSIDQKSLPFKMMFPPQKMEHKLTPQLLLANQMDVKNAVYNYMHRNFVPMMGPNTARQFRQRLPFDDPYAKKSYDD